jgi:hypothetical protein
MGHLTEDLSRCVLMNIKLVYTSIIDKKISSFVQALIGIFNFYFGCVTYGPPCIYGIFLCEDTFFFRQHIITFSFNVFQTRSQVKQSRLKFFLCRQTPCSFLKKRLKNFSFSLAINLFMLDSNLN